MVAPFGKIADIESTERAWPAMAVYLSQHPLILSSVFGEFGSPSGVNAALDETEKIIRSRIAGGLAQVDIASRQHISSRSTEAMLYGAWKESNFSKSSERAWNRAREQTAIDFTSFRKDSEDFLLMANGVVKNELIARFGVERVALWDFSDPPLRWEVPVESWQFSSSVNLSAVLDRFSSPFTRVAKILDFYQRNRLQIRSLIARTESETLWGGRNALEITQALTRLIDKQPEFSWGWADIVLALADNDAETIHQPTGIQFENDCLAKLINAGISAALTPSGPDKGVDIHAEIGGTSVAIQCKSHSKPVGIKAVQEAHSGARFYRCDYGLVVGDSGFTAAAEDLASQTNVLLATSASLVKIISLIPQKSS